MRARIVPSPVALAAFRPALTATAVGTGQINLSASLFGRPDVTGWQFEFALTAALAAAGQFQVLALKGPASFIAHNNLSPSQTVFYRVKTFFKTGAISRYSPVAQATTQAVVGPVVPTIAAVSGTSYLGPSSITGTGFAAGSITVTLGGVTQVATVNSDTSITIPSLTRSDGTNQCGYGNQNLVITSSSLGASAPFPIVFGPQAGGQFVVLAALDLTTADRITAVPDYGPGDLLAGFGTAGAGNFTLFSDGSFAYDVGVTGFNVEVFSTALRQWGAAGFQTTT